MDEQEDTLDFQALRAKFQDKELFLGPPKTKPVIPEKPKVIPPPLSPTSPLPSGARPSLLTSINHALESRTINAPRVVFKDDKKDNKNLINYSNSKTTEKSDGKPKENKDKIKESKEKPNDVSVDHKEKNGKKLPFFGSQKENTAELVPASPPPKAKTQRKKNILGFMKSSKKDQADTSAESILDLTNGDHAGPPLLIPVASEANNMPEESIYSVPKPILSKLTIPEPSSAVDLRALSIPEPPDFSPPPAIIPPTPVSRIPARQSETLPQMESPDLPVSNLPSKEKVPDSPIVAPSPPLVAHPSPPVATFSPQPVVAPSPPLVAPPSPPVATFSPQPIVAPSPPPTAPPSPPPRAAHPLRAIPSPPPSFANSDPPYEVFAPSPPPSGHQDVAGSEAEAHPAAEDSPSSKQERPISALSVLERIGDLSTGKRTPPSDQRILSALEKARKKASSPLPESRRPTPSPEDLPYHLNPTSADEEFPPIKDEGKLSLEPEVCDTEHSKPSLVLHNLAEERSNTPLEQLVVPPPPPRRVLPDPQTVGPAPEKPKRPPSVNLVQFIPPPPLIPEEIPVPPGFSEPHGTNVPEFEDLADAYSLELPVSESGKEEYTATEVPDVPNHSEFYGNGIADPAPEVRTETAYEDDYQENPPQEESHQAAQDHSLSAEDPQAPYRSSTYESNEDLYEPVKVSSSKKKGKINSKGKWAPKNPYVENAQETAQEKPKTSRFGRSEKKHASDKPDEKELKKKEKQRLEKEKKELKEKQGREKKEQKEKEKRENEMKKKFSITGNEEPMYQAKVNVTTKGRKHDLPVNSGDFISIIRTTKCPKGKWLARDSSNTYGYVSVSHLEMDFKEMLELGKKTPRSSAVTETETVTDGKVLNHFSRSGESFSDDSEEWTYEDDEPYSPGGHTRTFSMPEMGNKDFAINHQHSQSDLCDNSQIQARQEALQKLATFLGSSKTVNPAPIEPSPQRSTTPVQEEAVIAPPESSTQEREFDPTAVILPPPDMYADSMLDSSLYSEPNKNLLR